MREDVQVIIGFAESFATPEVVWSLVGAGFRVTALARRRSRAAIRSSRYVSVHDLTAPERDAAATIAELTNEAERIRKANSTVVLMPLDDAAVWLFSQVQVSGVMLVGSGRLGPDFHLDKDLQIETARGVDFAVPETVLLEKESDLDKLRCTFPMILKPRAAVALRNGRLVRDSFHLCGNRRQMAAVLERSPGCHFLAQPYISGVGHGLFGLATRQGVRAWSAHRRLRMMNPIGSGASACASVAPNGDAIAAGKRLIDRAAWRGPFMIELLKDEQGQYWFMEFNGRIWGSTALARRCGLEYPAWAVLDVLDMVDAIPIEPEIPLGVVCRHAGREALHGLFVLRGNSSPVPVRWPSRWNTLVQLFQFRPEQRWYNWRRDEWRVFVRDLVATLTDFIFKCRSRVL